MEEDGQKGGGAKKRSKQASAGGWNWLKSKRGSNALLATIAGAVATGLAVAGIVVPLNDLKQRMGVVESRGALDPILDHLEAVDGALAAIKKADPVGAVATLAPELKSLAGEVGDIRSSLGGEDSTTTTRAATIAAVVTPATSAPTVSTTVMARLDAAEAKLGDLAQSVATTGATTQSLSKAVDAVRSDLAVARDELASVKALAMAAKASADAVAARVDAIEPRLAAAEPRLPVVLTVPDANIAPGQSADSAAASVTIPAAAKYLVVFQAAPNNTDRCQTFILKHNNGTYASGNLGGIDAKLAVRTLQLSAGAHSFSATFYAAAPGGNNSNCVVVSPLFWLQKL